MNKKLTILGLTFIGLMVLGSIPITITAQDDKTEVTFWYTENETEGAVILDQIADFEEANPDIDIVEKAEGFFGAKDAYTTAAAANQEPIVLRSTKEWALEFSFDGLIQPITEYIDEDDFLDETIRVVTYPDDEGREQIWAFPQVIDAPGLFYNKALLEDAGVDISDWDETTSLTWTEFLAAAEAVYDENIDVNGTRAYGFTYQGMFYAAYPAYAGHGAEFFEDGEVSVDNIALDSDESKTAWTFMKDLVDADYTPDWDGQGWGTINQLFTEGKVAMIQQGPWEFRNFFENAPAFNAGVEGALPYAELDNLGIMQMPQDDDGNSGAPLGGQNYVLSARAEGDVLDAAVKFMQFMTTEEANKERALELFLIPAREGVIEDSDVEALDEYKYMKAISDIVENAYQVPVDHRMSAVEGVLGPELEEYLAGDQTQDEMIADMINKTKEILETNEGRTLARTPVDTYSFLLAFIAVPVLFRIVRRRKD